MKAIPRALAVAGAVITAATLAVAPGPANAATVSFVVQAAGANVTPAVVSGGAANAQFYFDDETNELTYTVAIVGMSLEQIMGAQLNRGAAGEEGPVAYTLSDEPFTQIVGSLELSDEDVDALFAGELYLNVLSVDFPEGFARGQLIPPEVATSEDGVEASTDIEASEEIDADASEEDVAASAAVQPPNTGDAGLADSNRGTGLAAAIFLLGLIGAGSTAVLIRRRA
ncbi:MAG TPA: CHRD domain-containing protein [Dehalococcoidia bacterium]|nr:CHRD domain-containing protein [Dehalococcoidia bacterium]